MTVNEASFNGTFRTVVVLMMVWFILRMILRNKRGTSASQGAAPGASRNQREPGDVRIEEVKQPERSSPIRPSDTIIDADYEEVK